MAAAKEKRVAFRVFSGNRLTIPLLLNIWERHGLDARLGIQAVMAEPGRLTAAQAAALLSSDACVYSFMTPHLPLIAGEIKGLRGRGHGGPLLVAGGPHVAGEQELARACGFDLLFGGAGEEEFLQFGRDLLEGKFKPGSGPVAFPAPECGTGRKGASGNWEMYIPVSRLFKTVPPLEISRGCSWKCRYCQTGRTKPLHRGEESIAFYLDELRRRGLPRVGFISPSALEFGASRPGRPCLERIAGLLERCRLSGFRLIEYGIFPSEIRPDTVSPEALRLLRRHVANRRLTFGAQSAADSRLKAIGRGHRAADVENAVRAANDAGFAANLDFIIALPGETADERAELLEFMARLGRRFRVYFQLHHFFPLAGSAFARRKPSFLSQKERTAFMALRRSGSASDWWLEGERSAHAYLAWLERDFPGFFAQFG